MFLNKSVAVISSKELGIGRPPHAYKLWTAVFLQNLQCPQECRKSQDCTIEHKRSNLEFSFTMVAELRNLVFDTIAIRPTVQQHGPWIVKHDSLKGSCFTLVPCANRLPLPPTDSRALRQTLDQGGPAAFSHIVVIPENLQMMGPGGLCAICIPSGCDILSYN